MSATFLVVIEIFLGQRFTVFVLLLKVLIGFSHIARDPVTDFADESIDFFNNCFRCRVEMYRARALIETKIKMKKRGNSLEKDNIN